MSARILSEEETQVLIQQKELWDALDWEGANFNRPIQLLETKGEIVGAVQGEVVGDSYYVGYFFVFQKGQGWGSVFIELLKKEYPKIHGNALPSSISFWERAGMTFLESSKEGHHPFEYHSKEE